MAFDMDQWLEPVPLALVQAITGRTNSLLNQDMQEVREDLEAIIKDSKVLIIGAAGSIGSTFVKLLTMHEPAALALVDLNENGMADLVRDLRSGQVTPPADFRTSVVAFGSVAFQRFLEHTGPYDAVFNFSALKHVRTERDSFGLMRMIETNALAVDDLLRSGLLKNSSRFFSVSTDKAVNPSNLMGATKRWMERSMSAANEGVTTTSARFANVAFSAGSLPQAFIRRIEMQEPLAGPSDVSRYFISHQEAAQLCLLSGFLGKQNEVFVPNLGLNDAVSMMDVARRTLSVYGMEANFLDSEQEARVRVAPKTGAKTWPCFFGPSDTSGEKTLEELSYETENPSNGQFSCIVVSTQKSADEGILAAARERLNEIKAEKMWRKADLVEVIRLVVPELKHIETGRSLDQKM